MACFLRGRDEGRKETAVLHKRAMTFDWPRSRKPIQVTLWMWIWGALTEVKNAYPPEFWIRMGFGWGRMGILPAVTMQTPRERRLMHNVSLTISRSYQPCPCVPSDPRRTAKQWWNRRSVRRVAPHCRTLHLWHINVSQRNYRAARLLHPTDAYPPAPQLSACLSPACLSLRRRRRRRRVGLPPRFGPPVRLPR